MTVLNASGEQVRRDVVYILTTGRFSDYGIWGVFSTRAEAERIASELDEDESPEVDEWVIDGRAGETNGKVFAAILDDAGRLLRTEQRVRWRGPRYSEGYRTSDDDGYEGVSAVSAEDAHRAAMAALHSQMSG